MKLRKAIKLHTKLRVQQEILFEECVLWSQKMYKSENYQIFPKLGEYSAINNAVKRIEKKLPSIYFLLSDLFGGAKRIKKLVIQERKQVK